MIQIYQAQIKTMLGTSHRYEEVVLLVDHQAALAEREQKFAILHEQTDIVIKQRDSAIEQIAALRHSLKIQRNEWERLNKHIDKQDEQLAALEEVHADHKRLVRKLDVLINREDGAAEQASLCDLIAQLNRFFPNHAIIDTCKYFVGQIAALTAEKERLQRARIADAEIIGRWQCEAETLTAENKRSRQIVIDCHAGWPDEVLQKTLRGKEVM